MKDLNCNWIDADSYCHMNQCMVKHQILDLLEEEFKKLNLKHLDFALFYDTYCDRCESCWFLDQHEVKVRLTKEFEKLEKDARHVAKKYIKSLKKQDLINIYNDLKYKRLEQTYKNIKKELDYMGELLDDNSK